MESPDGLAPLNLTVSRPDRLFPALTPQQIARIETHGRRRATTLGDVLVDVGDRPVPFFVVLRGAIEPQRPREAGHIVIASIGPSQFTGEGSLMSGRRSVSRLRVTEPGEVIRKPAIENLSRFEGAAFITPPHPAIVLRTQTEIVALDGERELERIRWRDAGTGETEDRRIAHVFMMTGAAPNTAWLGDCVITDEKGFVKTGVDLSQEELAASEWPLARPPFLLETNRPGIFAVGDVRSGNVKRVASAVGEGSIAVAFVHQVLRQ